MSETLNKIGAETEAAKRAALRGLLRKCTKTQRLVFMKVYGLRIPTGKLDSVIKICEKTIWNNENL